MMKILLPACFIALKLTGTFIDFMLGLANSNVQEDTQITTAKGRDSRHHQIEIIFCCPTFIVKPWTEVLEIFDLYENSSAADSYISTGANKLKSLLSSKTVESFEFRTCVKPKLSKNQFGETEIIYESLTAKDLLWNQNFFNFLWVGEFFFLKLEKFVNSDEGLPCVNTIEKIYLGLLVTVFALAIFSFFRLSHFKAELRKVFDPRDGFTFRAFSSSF